MQIWKSGRESKPHFLSILRENFFYVTLFLISVGYIVYLCARPVIDDDIFLHLSYGRQFWQNPSWVITDQWTWTHLGERWIRWTALFGIILYPLYEIFGLMTLFWYQFVSTIFWFVLLVRFFSRQLTREFSVILSLFFITAVQSRLEYRAETLVYALFTILILLVLRMAPFWKKHLSIIAFLVLWQLYQNSSYLGILFYGSFILWNFFTAADKRKWLTVGVLTLIAITFLHPDSYWLLWHTWKGAEFEKWYPVAEHQPPLAWIYTLFYIWVVAVIIGMWELRHSKRFRFLFIALPLFGILLLKFRRGIPFFMIASIPAGLAGVLRWKKTWDDLPEKWVSLVLLVPIMAAGVFFKETPFTFPISVSPWVADEPLAKFIERTNPPDHIFNPMENAAWLIWRLDGKKLLYWDARTSIHIQEAKEVYQFRQMSSEELYDFFQRKGIRTVIYSNQHAGAQEFQSRFPDSKWAEVYSDPGYRIFVDRLCPPCAPYIQRYEKATAPY